MAWKMYQILMYQKHVKSVWNFLSNFGRLKSVSNVTNGKCIKCWSIKMSQKCMISSKVYQILLYQKRLKRVWKLLCNFDQLKGVSNVKNEKRIKYRGIKNVSKVYEISNFDQLKSVSSVKNERRIKYWGIKNVSKVYEISCPIWSAQKCIKCHKWKTYQILRYQKHLKSVWNLHLDARLLSEVITESWQWCVVAVCSGILLFGLVGQVGCW